MTRASDRAELREGRVRRAELRLFAAARAYAARLDRFSARSLPEVSKAPELPSVIERLTELEAAALHFAEVVPAPLRRRRDQGP